jgi:hypothetical protein
VAKMGTEIGEVSGTPNNTHQTFKFEI